MFEKWKRNEQENPVADNAQGGIELTLEQASPVTRSIIAHLGYPCRIFSSKASYEEVINAYDRAVLQGQKEGFTPLLVPMDETLDEHLGILKEEGYSLETVLKSKPGSGKEILDKRNEEYAYEEAAERNMEELIDGFDGEPEAIDGYMAFRKWYEEEIVETILLKVPTTRPWELAAYVPFGGWNECPDAEEMMAVCKYWYDKYGAVPVTISHDVMEMRVPAPVAGQDAMQAAREHYAFCPDRIDQCTETGTLSELAACIAASEIWYFWWD